MHVERIQVFMKLSISLSLSLFLARDILSNLPSEKNEKTSKTLTQLRERESQYESSCCYKRSFFKSRREFTGHHTRNPRATVFARCNRKCCQSSTWRCTRAACSMFSRYRITTCVQRVLRVLAGTTTVIPALRKSRNASQVLIWHYPVSPLRKLSHGYGAYAYYASCLCRNIPKSPK